MKLNVLNMYIIVLIKVQRGGIKMIFCGECGTKNDRNANFCRQCGRAIVGKHDFHKHNKTKKANDNVTGTLDSKETTKGSKGLIIAIVLIVSFIMLSTSTSEQTTLFALAIFLGSIGAGFLNGASIYFKKNIVPGFDRFIIVLTWHILWGVGWGFVLMGAAILVSIVPVIGGILGTILALLALLVFVLGTAPLLFGKIFAALFGFFADEIGDIPIVKKYFSDVHNIYWDGEG